MSIIAGATFSGYPEKFKLFITGKACPMTIYQSDDCYTLEGKFQTEGIFSLVMSIQVELPFCKEYADLFCFSEGSLQFQLYDIKKTANNFYLILEFCNEGDLNEYLK